MRGFGFVICNGLARWWYCGTDGIKRWADNDKPMEDNPK